MEINKTETKPKKQCKKLIKWQKHIMKLLKLKLKLAWKLKTKANSKY